MSIYYLTIVAFGLRNVPREEAAREERDRKAREDEARKEKEARDAAERKAAELAQQKQIAAAKGEGCITADFGLHLLTGQCSFRRRQNRPSVSPECRCHLVTASGCDAKEGSYQTSASTFASKHYSETCCCCISISNTSPTPTADPGAHYCSSNGTSGPSHFAASTPASGKAHGRHGPIGSPTAAAYAVRVSVDSDARVIVSAPSSLCAATTDPSCSTRNLFAACSIRTAVASSSLASKWGFPPACAIQCRFPAIARRGVGPFRVATGLSHTH